MSGNKRPASPAPAGAGDKRAHTAPAPAGDGAAAGQWAALLARMAPFEADRVRMEAEHDAIERETAEAQRAGKARVEAMRKDIEAAERAAEQAVNRLNARADVKRVEIELVHRREIVELADHEVWKIYNSAGADLIFGCEADARWAWQLLTAAGKRTFREPTPTSIDNWAHIKDEVRRAEVRLAGFLSPDEKVHVLVTRVGEVNYRTAFHSREAADAAEAAVRAVGVPGVTFEHMQHARDDLGNQIRVWFEDGDAAAQEGLLVYVRRHSKREK